MSTLLTPENLTRFRNQISPLTSYATPVSQSRKVQRCYFMNVELDKLVSMGAVGRSSISFWMVDWSCCFEYCDRYRHSFAAASDVVGTSDERIEGVSCYSYLRVMLFVRDFSYDPSSLL